MFSVPTVFILGAGASWHYGYPTGETLVKKVIEKAEIAAAFFKWSSENANGNFPQLLLETTKNQDWRQRWIALHDQCERLKRGLQQVNPLVIDYYLGWNADLQEIGRVLITWVILECEDQSRGVNINQKTITTGRLEPLSETRDDWCRFIIHQLAIHCQTSKDILSNKVSFVTFNYDVSLEVALKAGLQHIQMFDESDVEKFLDGSRIVHIYGKVRDIKSIRAQVKWPNSNPIDTSRIDFCSFLDVVYSASKGIRVIDPHDKGANGDDLTIAQTQIHAARRVFILGYGFDEHNSERLRLNEALKYGGNSPKMVAFTNFGDINQVNKRASKVLFGNTASFPPNGQSIAYHAEKSTRNAYDALALDFDIA
jgi:hypothetical protein